MVSNRAERHARRPYGVVVWRHGGRIRFGAYVSWLPQCYLGASNYFPLGQGRYKNSLTRTSAHRVNGPIRGYSASISSIN